MSDETEQETRSTQDEPGEQVVKRLYGSIRTDALAIAHAESISLDGRERLNESGHSADDAEQQNEARQSYRPMRVWASVARRERPPHHRDDPAEERYNATQERKRGADPE